MRVVHLSYTDTKYGADRASCRLHQGLLSAGVDSWMVVGRKFGSDERVRRSANSVLEKVLDRMRFFLDQSPLRVYRNRSPELFSTAWVPDRVSRHPLISSSDIVNLHWVCGGFLRPESIARINKPVVWRLSDMWAFTGGCHYSGGCVGYQQECGFCPHLGSHHGKDLSRWLWRRKERSWRNIQLTIVTPSRWLSSCAERSSLFKKCRIEVIPNGINDDVFKPKDKYQSKKILGLSTNKKIILFGAINPTKDRRKGIRYLVEALDRLAGDKLRDELELAVLGTSKPEKDFGITLPVHYLGYVEEVARLVRCYSAADVFVAPSEQDNFPSTVLESLACGTPAIAFHVGGIPDLIEHRRDGYLVKPFDTTDLGEGIRWVLSDPSRSVELSKRARQKVEEKFTLGIQAGKYLRLYEQISGERIRDD
jgi:glycosyltransferase involved in cell wall biosynthesis